MRQEKEDDQDKQNKKKNNKKNDDAEKIQSQNQNIEYNEKEIYINNKIEKDIKFFKNNYH